MGIQFPRKKKILQRPIVELHGPLPEGRVRISELNFDEVEHNLLRALRLIASSYANPQSQTWEVAFDSLVDVFGKTNGPVVSYALTNVMRAMRRSRRSVFRFNNPFCPCCKLEATAMEKHLMKTVQSLRNGDPMTAATQSMMLCEGHSTVDFMDAIHGLIALLPGVEKPALKNRMTFRTA